jgi:VWFA-related protein
MRTRIGLATALLLVVSAWLSAQPGPAPQSGTPPVAPARVDAARVDPAQASPAQESPAQVDPLQGPTFRTGAEAVTVDVNVLDRQGHPVRGLAPGDFTVTVGGQTRRVISADFVSTALNVDATAAPPDVSPISTNEGGGTGRLFVFIVDQSTLETGNARQVARAASRFLDRLTFSDRSALVLVPVGKNVGFTWNHDRVQEGLRRVTGLGNIAPEWQYGSLAEARDIANRNPMALRTVQERECRTSTFASTASSAAPTLQGPAPSQGPGDSGGGGSGGGAQPGGEGQTSAPTPSGGSGNRGGNRGSGFGGGNDACSREIQMQAETAWREMQMTSFASLTALRQALGVLARVKGDKTIVLISGGLPLDEREHTSVLSTVADDAAAAHATFYSIFVPSSNMSVTRRTMSTSPIMDQQVNSWPLETLAGMTGGSSYRADVGADGVFDRLGRELAGYYRLGVEKLASDAAGKPRRLKVQVARNGTNVRARDLFDVRTYEDRDWTARLADALVSPIAATGLGLRVTSYVAPDPEDNTRVKLVLAGEASRLQPGQATFQVVVRNLEGQEVTSGEQPLGEVSESRLPFSTNVNVAPGSYVVRLAVMDSAGHVGSVDHRVEARRLALGPLSASGPMLVRVPARREQRPRLAIDTVQQDERLALQMDLEGDQGFLSGTKVVFEIAATADGPALVTIDGEPAPTTNERSLTAQAVADVRVLPPGAYVARAKVHAGPESVGELHRAFAITEAPKLVAETTTEATVSKATPPPERLAARAAGTVPRFALDQVLAPRVVGEYLDRVALRPDATSPALRELMDRARTASIRDLVVSDALAAEAPVLAPFLKGLMLLSQGKVDPAASAFRTAMRASADFYPAMVYLGACYAARGQDKEAAGAWNTALIKERDARTVHVLLADALMRSGREDLALQALERARSRWPDDHELKRRFAVAAIAGGRYADGLQAVDDLLGGQVDDEPMLALALLALYDAFVSEKPIEDVGRDRERMTRLAGLYRTRGGPSLALVETWVAAANRDQK